MKQRRNEQVDAARGRSKDAGSARPKIYRRPWLCVVSAVVVAGLALAACGGATPNPQAAGSSSTIETGSSASSGGAGARQALALRYAQCMRSHGVANYPDPSASGAGGVELQLGGVDTNSPLDQVAQQSCKKYLGGGSSSSPAQQTQDEAKMLLYAHCMRSHGLPSFPDPVTGPDGTPMFQLGTRVGVNTNSPTYQSANSACRSLEKGISSSG